MAHSSVCLVAIVLCLVSCASSVASAESIRLPLYRNFFVSVLVGNEGKEKRLRLRFDEDKIVIYGSPSGGTFDVNTGLSYVSLGPLVANLTLPLYYTWQGDSRVSDPIATNQRVSYSGVLGLGPGSPIWINYQYDSWRLERDWLVIGEPAPSNALSLPSFVAVDPRNDFTTISDLPTYLRWLSTLPSYRAGASSINSSDPSSLEFAGQQASASSTEQQSAELSKYIRVYSRTSRSGGEWFSRADYSTVDTAMVLDSHSKDSDRIEVDAYTVDSTSGYYVEMVRFEPRASPAASNNFSILAKRKRQALLDPSGSAPVIVLGLLHAADYTLFGTADLGTVLLSPSPSGPFRPQASAFVWLFMACFLLAFINVPGIWERFQRARRLYMPTRPNEYLHEIAKVHEDWTYLLLVCRLVLFAAFWVLHMALTTYRSMKSFNGRGWYVAYYVPVGYMLANVVFGPVRYLDRHSTVRYSIAMQLAAVLLLSNGYEFVISTLLMLMLSFNALRLASDRFLSSIIRPDGDLDGYQQTRLLLLAFAEAVWLAWFSAFYILDHVLYQVQHNTGMLVFSELIVLILFLGLSSITVCLMEEVVRIRPNVALLASLINERLTAQLNARREGIAQLARRPTNNTTDESAQRLPAAEPSAQQVIVPQHFHFGMNLRPIDAAVAMQAGQAL